MLKYVTGVFLLLICAYVLVFNTKNIIYIYEDAGVSPESLRHTLHFFKKNKKLTYKIEMIDAEGIKSNHWTKRAALLVIPGGADIPYTQKLNGLGNQNIKHYVENGGSYLGLCAGAYYASQYVEFDKGGKLQVLGDRELAFFPGKAIGPNLAPYVYKSNEGARAASIQTQFNDKTETIYFYYNGGGYFEDADSIPNVSVLGWYKVSNDNKLPAILHIKVGKGKVILSGVHFEYDPSLLDKNDPYLQKILPILERSSESSQNLTQLLLKKLDL